MASNAVKEKLKRRLSELLANVGTIVTSKNLQIQHTHKKKTIKICNLPTLWYRHVTNKRFRDVLVQSQDSNRKGRNS